MRKRWVLGYDMYRTRIVDGRKVKPGAGFTRQIYGAARCLRHHMDTYKDGATVKINLDKAKVRPANSATYALFKYTPFWGGFVENGSKCSGNETFRATYKYLLKYWKQEKGGNKVADKIRGAIVDLLKIIKTTFCV